MKTRLLMVAVAVAAAAAAYVMLAGRPASQPKKAKIAVTGIYADDWQTNCAPLTGPAQAECTAALDAGYGKTDGAPVPPMK